MQPRRHPLLVTFLLALHVTVLGTAPIADAIAEASSARTFVHIEAPGRNKCPPVHDDLTCQFCRVVSHNQFGSVSALPLFAAASIHVPGPSTSPVVGLARDGVTPFAPRPPPIA
jgi:hypothetical protein